MMPLLHLSQVSLSFKFHSHHGKSSNFFAVFVFYLVLYAAEGILVLAFYGSDSLHYQHFSCVFFFCPAAFSLLGVNAGDNSYLCDTSDHMGLY